MASTLALLVAVASTHTVRGAGPVSEIFAMDNGVGRGTWSPERQASTLEEIGFNGISYNYTNPVDLKAWLAALAPRKLKLYGIYFGVQLQEEKPLPAGLDEAVQLLRGTGAVLWLTVPKPKLPGDYSAQELKCVRDVADLAAGARLRVVLYPHHGFYLATAERACELVARSGRANLGVTFNLCHELAAGNGGRIPEIIRRVAPSLAMVTINGATDRSGPGWDNYIKRLGEGDFDVGTVLKTLAEVDYLGPVGIQYFSLKGDPRENLEASMRAWRALNRGSSFP